MTYEEWLTSVPAEFTQDPLWRMEVYRLAVFAGDLAWRDVSRLAKDRRTVSLANQLFRAVGSTGANIAEGYSRRSGKDQARMYEYALGSAREARGWYRQGTSCPIGGRHYAPHQAVDPDHPPAPHHHPRRAWTEAAGGTNILRRRCNRLARQPSHAVNTRNTQYATRNTPHTTRVYRKHERTMKGGKQL